MLRGRLAKGAMWLGVVAAALALACDGTQPAAPTPPSTTPPGTTPPGTTPPAPTPPSPGTPSRVLGFGWGFSLTAGDRDFEPYAGVALVDAQYNTVGAGVAVRFAIVQGSARIDTSEAATDENGIVRFHGLHIPPAPAAFVLRVYVKGRPMQDFRIEAVDPEVRPVAGSFALTAIDDITLPVPYPASSTTAADSVIAATLTFESLRYQLLMTIRHRDGTRDTVIATGQLEKLDGYQPIRNVILYPDGLPSGTYFDRNPGFVAADGRLQVLNASDDGWPLPGGLAAFVRNP